MKIAYSVYYALSHKNAEISADEIERNSDCGRLNLVCGCCYERVYWVNRKNQKFFSHFPGVADNEKCEKFTVSTEPEKRRKGLISAINREKTQYEKYFWTILKQCYPAINRYSSDIARLIKTTEMDLAFNEFYYPELQNQKSFLLALLNDLFNSNIELDLSPEELGKNYRIYKLVLRKSSKVYREVIVELLFGFLMQKRSMPIVRELYALSLRLVFDQLGRKIPTPEQANSFAINLLLSLIIWIPWEECLNDVKCYGKVLPKHCYEDNFMGFLIGKIETQQEEEIPCFLTIN